MHENMMISAHCGSCGSADHMTGHCPSQSPLPYYSNHGLPTYVSPPVGPSGAGFTSNSLPSSSILQPPQLGNRSFIYPGAPQIPSFADYPTAGLLVNDLLKWGQAMENWAQGFQSFSIQMNEMVKLDSAPLFRISDNGFNFVIQIPDTFEGQLAMDSAVSRANAVINQFIPSGFPTSATINPSSIFARQFNSTQLTTPIPDLTFHHETGVKDTSPTPRGKVGGRGTGAGVRVRGVSSRYISLDYDSRLTSCF